MPPDSENSGSVFHGKTVAVLVLAAVVLGLGFVASLFYSKNGGTAGGEFPIETEEDKADVLNRLLMPGESATSSPDDGKKEIIENLIPSGESGSKAIIPATQESYDSAAAEKIKLLESLKANE